MQDLLEDFAASAPQPLSRRERRVEAGVAVAFLAAATAMAALIPWEREFSPVTTLVLVCAFAVTKRVKFEIGVGYAVPTQIVFVPMLFLLPAPVVPAVVLAGVLLGNLPDYVRGRAHVHSVLLAPGDCWYAVGPALVVALAGVDELAWADWPLLLAALGAQFAFDFAFATLQDWAGLGIAPRMQPRLMGWVLLVDLMLAPLGLLAAFAAADQPYAFLLALPLAGLLAVFAHERSARIEHAIELGRAYRGTTLLLGDVVKADDEYTGAHSHGVVALALSVADEMGLDARRQRNVEFGALLHDVGKIAIPREIITKPAALTDDEWTVIKTHTIEGQRMLDRVGGVMGEVGQIVRSSHEHWDGGGYPDALAGEAIPLESRVVACCDAFNAMTTDRPYRAAMTLDDAVAELRACAGTQFDPAVVAALRRVIAPASPVPAPAVALTS